MLYVLFLFDLLYTTYRVILWFENLKMDGWGLPHPPLSPDPFSLLALSFPKNLRENFTKISLNKNKNCK